MSDQLTNEDILQQVAAGSLSAEEAAKLLSKEKPKRSITYKISNKGAISFYDLRRMPITLYVGELEKIVSAVCTDTTWSDDFQEFLDNAGDSVSRKS